MAKSTVPLSLSEEATHWLNTKGNRSGFVDKLVLRQKMVEKEEYKNLEDVENAIEDLKNKREEVIKNFDKDLEALTIYKESWNKDEKDIKSISEDKV